MKRTVELDTLEIADRLNDLSGQAAVIAAAVSSLNGHPQVEGGIVTLAWELHDSIRAISEKMHPDPDEAEPGKNRSKERKAA